MSTTEPIRTKENLEKFKNYYTIEKPNARNRALINFGLNSILRISDLLQLKWKDVYNFEADQFKTHMELIEMKTGKKTKIILNQNAVSALNDLKNTLSIFQADMYIFHGQQNNTHLSRSQAYRIIRSAAEKTHIGEDISCHSLRKTFGYHAWKNGTPPAMLMELYNHSSYAITKHYLGIDQNEKDSVFLNLNL